MGENIQGSFATIEEPIGKQGAFIDALNTEIQRLETGEPEAEAKLVLLAANEATVNSAMQKAGDVLSQFFNNAYQNAFNDEGKFMAIKEFIVKDMGVTDSSKMAELIPKMLLHAETVTKMKMSLIDKLLYLVLQEKAHLGKGKT